LYRPACFHAQQCAEKYLKALLTARQIVFPRTHDVEELLTLLDLNGGLPGALRLGQLEPLNPHAVGMRYPGDLEPVDAPEAHLARELANHVRTIIREALPAEVLVIP